MEDRKRIAEKIQALLALGDRSRNSSDEEAQAAILKAQELMAKYNVVAEESKQFCETVSCEHKWNYGYRTVLAPVLANNFRCEAFMENGTIAFIGHAQDAKLCKEVFEFAYKFIMRRGNALYNKAYNCNRPTKGIFNSYASGFLVALREQLNAQSTALLVVVPDDVKKEFAAITAGAKTVGWRNSSAEVDFTAYAEGCKDGKQFAQNNIH